MNATDDVNEKERLVKVETKLEFGLKLMWLNLGGTLTLAGAIISTQLIPTRAAVESATSSVLAFFGLA